MLLGEARSCEFEEDDSSKRQRGDDAKRQRINQMKIDYEKRLGEVKLAYKEHFTVDDYSTDLNVDDEVEDDVWAGEHEINLQSVPTELWFDERIDKPPKPPDKWIDDLADRVEIQRLQNMQVLVPVSKCQDDPTGKLTTKFVRDWRLNRFGEGLDEKKRWMRRSRLVAREFANTKRLGTFSPATGARVSKIFPLKSLWMKALILEVKTKEKYDVVLAALDVRDTCLQVDQDKPVLVNLQEPNWVIKKNLPRQRLGTRQWFQYLKAHLQNTMDFEFSMVSRVWQERISVQYSYKWMTFFLGGVFVQTRTMFFCQT